MSKRRRTSSIASRNQEEDSLDSLEASTSSGPTMRKRRKLQDPMELCHQLYDIIRNHKKVDGSLLCDSFIRVPKRRQEPGYYDVVNNPIDLLKVQQKLKTDEYADVDDLHSDIELIVHNTKAFYKKNTQEYKDAVELWDLFLTTKSNLLNPKDDDDQKPLKTSNRVKRTPVRENNKNERNHNTHSDKQNNVKENEFEKLYDAVLSAKDSENKPLHTFFQVLPSKKKYPDYYEVVETPIDLKMIDTKIQSKKYNILAEMERDLLLMTKNACLYNEPGSQIFKHAKALKKFIQNRRFEHDDHSKTTPNRTGPKKPNNTNNSTSTPLPKQTRSKNTPNITPSNKNNKIVENDHDDGDDQFDEDGEPLDSDNPLWKLFDAVQSVTNSNGVPLSEPFWRLPSRRFYPDYYREIKNPMSLTQIKRKLLKSAYGNLSEVAGDLTVMFENAKKYNIQTSKLYKDAVKLQKIMQSKVQELLYINQGSDSDDDKPVRRKPGPKPKNSLTPTPTRGRPPKDSIPLKKRLHALAKYMLEYTCEDGRKPMLAFMQKPSKKLYADYYEVIAEPIDFLDIESKIRADQYSSEKDLVLDFKLMFSNCREFNEENSPLFEDALALEKYLMDKAGNTLVTPEKERKERPLRTYKPRTKHVKSPLEKNLQIMYESIRDYKDPKSNRQLSQIFMKLPSKIEYPDYYEVIKTPIDIEKISQKLRSNHYETLDDLVADFVLMFDNACKYNEPDSQIYKDALVLQRVCFQTKLQLKEDDNTVPDVPSAIQDILLTLFTTAYNHQDEEGRCYSDSMADLPEHDEVDGKKIRALSLDLLKRRLDKGLYKRLDIFQEDFFACMERARRLSRTDSQVFEDSVELQRFFIRQRDELCKNGELLLSSALSFTLNDATAAIETLRHSKHLQESLEDESETRSSDDSIIKDSQINSGDSMTCNQRTFKVGEFVYVESKEKGVDPHILMIERLFENKGQQMLHGNYYVKPAETYHVTTRKFLEKEVFKSDTHVTVPLEDVIDRCCVVNVKHYFTMRPEGYDDKDVYVCESRYSARIRTFKKIKIYPDNPTIKLVPRDVPLEPKRVVSVFRERVEKHKDELAELQEQEQLVEKEKPNVIAYTNMDIDDGNTYYEQFNTICSGVVKTGDFVYVAAEGGRQLIAQIDSIWETRDGKSYFRGPWFVPPSGIPQNPPRLFYKQEMFLSSLEDTNPLVSIMGKCVVLEYNDYISLRPTEIAESDVFICCSLYDEVNRQVKRLAMDTLKKYSHSGEVTEDEIYFFPKLINPPKEPPQLTKMNDMDITMEDSMDGGPPSVGSGEIPTIIATPGNNTPVTPATSKKKTNKNKVVTGYILYSREVRKQVVQNNPESTFGDISRIVGSEWKSLPANEKQGWEEKASKLNEETKALLLSEEQCSSPATVPTDQIYECLWENCDYQFEEVSDLIDHCIKDKDTQGHVQAYFQENAGSELNCHWRNCIRNNKKNIQPFPNIARLIRHVRDRHINKGNGRSVPPENRSKNFKPSSKPAAVARPSSSATPNPPATSTFNSTAGSFSATTNTATSTVPNTTQQPQKVQEPMFITVPPRPQRVLHSEAYIKYIEGLSAENKHITQWERTLNATQENTPAPDLEKLHQVTTWLGRKADQHDNVVAAIWALRNQLLRDTLGLHKTL